MAGSVGIEPTTRTDSFTGSDATITSIPPYKLAGFVKVDAIY